MVRISNTFLALLNITSLLSSLVIIGFSLFIRFKGASQCEKFIFFPLLIVGVVLFVLSLLGLIGSGGRITPLLWIYLVLVFLLIVAVSAFTVFTFIVTNKGVGQVVSGRGYKEYRLGNYTHWLSRHLMSGRIWESTKSCMIEFKVCQRLGLDGVKTQDDFYKKRLTPIQSGCCEPPMECGFRYQNLTSWAIPQHGPASNNSDCKIWSYKQDHLCYYCESCKAGFLGNLKKEWKDIAVFNVAVLIILILVWSIGCCAFRNNRIDSRSGYKRF